ncbi:exodeoxyribonuclease VII large subunit [Nibricoccus sp. IMCC34717]|uniref:exodeoxyribonuclease VII large subunit n=1 Tax=Nibricoccus sp. IMCC34717 TaxID=3034021 RepID=UPI003850AF18
MPLPRNKLSQPSLPFEARGEPVSPVAPVPPAAKDAVDEPAGRVRSVTELSREIKAVLENSIQVGWVRGEISGLRAQASGHVYFSLKDAGAVISAVLFRGDAQRQRVALRDGLQVVVQGQLSVYEVRGQYQLIVRTVVEDGVGRLQREFEALKQKLAAEGLFAPERKRSLPTLPQCVGFVTSPTGAAVQDFIRILERRGWRGRLVVFPAKVQGEGAAAEVAAMLGLAAAFGGIDMLVVGRGGGSLEDLWAFNEEVLVRAVAASPIPVISAVGHEIDFTLCDFAADVRAETPSAAAELISSHFVAALRSLDSSVKGMLAQVGVKLARERQRLSHAQSRLRLLSPTARVERGWMRLDDLIQRLGATLEAAVRTSRAGVDALQLRLGSAGGRVLQKRQQRLVRAATHFKAIRPERQVEESSQRLLSLWKRLQAASPDSVLQRGFAIVRDERGAPVANAGQLRMAGSGRVQFADGEVPVSVK